MTRRSAKPSRPADSPIARARALRVQATEAEKVLWRMLRRPPFAACKFRRQHPVGGAIADLASLSLRLIIEIDGGQHADCEGDRARDRRLAALGWRTVRFWNHEVLQNPEGVGERVLAIIEETRGPSAPSPDPSPGGRGNG